MKLAEWMKTNRIVDAELARRLGISKSAVVRWRIGRSRPEWPVVEKLVDVTRGEVMPNDFLPDTKSLGE